jgi:4-amino-4-deoxy-L-arabinose transferase-like glycosyltransferase
MGCSQGTSIMGRVDKPDAGGFFRRWQHRLLLVAILAIALAVRLWRIDAQSIWYDEGWSIHLAQESLTGALAQIASPGHTHPPAYYLLLMGWVRLWGSSVLAVRSLSAVLGTLAVWATYGLAWRLYRDQRVALLAALLLALAPAHIVYSQETRMYALLGLGTVLVVQVGCRDDAIGSDGQPMRRWPFWRWALLLSIGALAVYTHYFAALSLLSLNLWVVAEIGIQRGLSRSSVRSELARWLGVQGALLMVWAPWLAAAVSRVLEHQTHGAVPIGVLAFFRETGAFLLGGHIALWGREALFAYLVPMVFIALAIVALGLLTQRGERRIALFLLVQILGPLLALLVLMQIRPGYHPRYLLILLPLLVVLLARGVVRLFHASAWRGLAALALLTLWFGTAGVAARALHVDPYYHRDDARATAALLQDVLSADGLVVVPTDDWALRYYLDENVEGIFLEVDRMDAAHVETEIERALQGRSEAALVRWHQGTSDHRNVLTYWLDSFGVRTNTYDLPGYTVVHYALHNIPAAMVETENTIRFEGLKVPRAAVQTEASRDDAIVVALTMCATAPLEESYNVSLRLLDQAGRIVAQQDALLLDQAGGTTSQWSLNEPVTVYQRLPLGPGIAPVTYTVDMGIYAEENMEGLNLLDKAGAPAGKRYELGTIQVAPGAKTEASSSDVDRARFGLVALAEPVLLTDGLALAAHTAIAEAYAPGQMVEVLLEWHHVGEGTLPALRPTIQLVRGGELLATASGEPVYGTYGTERWKPGEVVLDWRALLLPLEIDAEADAHGPALLQLFVDEDRPLTLGEIVIESVPRVLAPPSPPWRVAESLGTFVKLVGYDLDIGASMNGDDSDIVFQAGQDLVIILYWHALATPEIDYTVFAQLLNESGVLIAQHDGPPVGGERPTSGWVAGEYIRDEHQLHWLEDDYRGPAILQVGLYDPTTGERLMTPQGDSRIMLGDGTMVR